MDIARTVLPPTEPVKKKEISLSEDIWQVPKLNQRCQMHYSFITRCFSLLIFTRQCSSQDVAFRTLPGQDANVSRISVEEDIHLILNAEPGVGEGRR